jgi:threonine dehydrogenase-like Zn-dependent dehydrogenase
VPFACIGAEREREYLCGEDEVRTRYNRRCSVRALAVFPKTREIRVIESPHPARVTGTDVLLRVLEVGVCGTDREIAAFEYGSPPADSDYLVLGHEALAEVVEIGPDVTQVRKGDLVVPTVRRPCAHRSCEPCRANRSDFCVTGDFVERGIKGAHGFMQEWVAESEQHLVKVPRKLADVAVLIEPLTVAAKAEEQAHAVQSGLPWERARVRTLVVGAGPVGLLGALAASVSHDETYVYSRAPSTDLSGEITRGLGGTYMSVADVPIAELPMRIGRIDYIFEAVGVSSVAFAALDALGPNGLMVFTGIPALGAPQELDLDRIMRNVVLLNQRILGTVNAGRVGYEHALRHLEQAMFLFPDTVRAIITERCSIDDVPSLLRERRGLKQVVQLSKELTS